MEKKNGHTAPQKSGMLKYTHLKQMGMGDGGHQNRAQLGTLYKDMCAIAIPQQLAR